MPDSNARKSLNQRGLFVPSTQSEPRVMPSLSQLLAEHKNVVVLDAASTQIQVGLVRIDAPSVWAHSTAEAGQGMFVATQGVLTGSGLRLEDIGAFLFCEGPGSMLGV